MNSWQDWTNKQLNKEKNGTNWTCVSRRTSDKKEGVAQDGLDINEKIHKWCLTLKSLKGTDEYSDFRAFLNQKAMERRRRLQFCMIVMSSCTQWLFNSVWRGCIGCFGVEQLDVSSVCSITI
jgi:hypothetical protein